MNFRNDGRIKGFSLMELMVTSLVVSLVFALAVPNLNSFIKRSQLNNALRSVTGGLSNARYNAIMRNNPVKFSIEAENDENMIRLREQRGSTWVVIDETKLEDGVSVSGNASPVFYPVGDVAPLCTVLVGNDISRYKITISMAGRIKVDVVE